MTVLQDHREAEGILKFQLFTRGIACVGKTSSAPTGPLSAGDGEEGISSLATSLTSEMEAMEIFS